MATAKFMSLEWTGGNSAVIRGVKGGATPKNTCASSNGTFRAYEKGELRLNLVTSNGQKISRDIYSMVKRIYNSRITESFRNMLSTSLSSREFEVCDGMIINLNSILKDIIKNIA